MASERRMCLKVLSLFTGIGGIDLGFIQAGHEVVFANEIDKDACRTFRYNFKDTVIKQCDIKDIDLLSLPDFDCLAAGFPCQPFSVMGNQRGFEDSRGNMFFKIAHILDVRKPRAVFLENVANLKKHDNGRTFSIVINTLIDLGYTIKHCVIDPTDVNIPQYRARIFIVGYRNHLDMKDFTFPEPVPLSRSIEDIISRKEKHSEEFYYVPGDRYYKSLDIRMKGKTGIYRIDDSGVAVRRWDICPTLKANMGTYHDRVPVIRDDFGIRKLTPYECLAFQGFPESFRFPNISLNSAYKQVGNTVCVPVVFSIAKNMNVK